MRKPASTEIISDSVELGETDVCFLHIQLVGTHVRLPKMHKLPTEADFESSRSPPKSESILIHIVVQCFPHDNTAWSHSCSGYTKSNEPSVCLKLWSML